LTRGGQAGDLQGLSGVEKAESESVRGLVEEGWGFDAEVMDAVENAPDPDVAEITTREVPEDDVPSAIWPTARRYGRQIWFGQILLREGVVR